MRLVFQRHETLFRCQADFSSFASPVSKKSVYFHHAYHQDRGEPGEGQQVETDRTTDRKEQEE